MFWPVFNRFQSAETWNRGQRLYCKDTNGLWNGRISMSIFGRRSNCFGRFLGFMNLIEAQL